MSNSDSGRAQHGVHPLHEHSPHESLVHNEPDLASARVWTVYDHGPDNVRLIHLDQGPQPYLYDEERRLVVDGAPVAKRDQDVQRIRPVPRLRLMQLRNVREEAGGSVTARDGSSSIDADHWGPTR
jgi:hypothetical protein